MTKMIAWIRACAPGGKCGALTLQYLLAIGLAAGTLAARLSFGAWFGDRLVLVLFVLPILLSAYTGGLGPGLAATAVVALGTAYFLIPPVGTFVIGSSVDGIHWLLLIAIGVLMSTLLENRLHRAEPANVGSRADDSSIVRKIQIGFAFALTCLAIIGVVSFTSATRLSEEAKRVRDSERGIASLRQLLSIATDAETAQRGFVITGSENFLEPGVDAREQIAAAIARLRTLLAADPDQHQDFAKLARAMDARVIEIENVNAMRREGDLVAAQAAISSGRGKALHDQIRDLIARMEVREAMASYESERAVQRSTVFSQTMIAAGSALAFAFVAVALHVIRRDVAARQLAESELDRFFTLSLDFLCISSSDGFFKRVSPAVTDILGWSVEEFLAQPYIGMVHPDDQAATLREVEGQLSTGEKVLRFDNRYRHRDGSWRVLSWRSVPQPGGLMYASARDVTELKRMEATLRGSNQQLEQHVAERTAALAAANESLSQRERRFRALLEHGSDCISLMKGDGTFIYLSPAVRTVEGYEPDELVGRSVLELTPPEDREKVRESLRELSANPDRPIPILWRRQNKNGDWRWLEGVSTNLLTDPAVEAIVTNYRDITDRKHAEERALWLATFPECNPNPILEINLANGAIHYLNPAATTHFPDLKEAGLRHPILADLPDAMPQLRVTGMLRREVKVDGGYFSQTVSYIAATKHLRIYNTDVTERRTAELALREKEGQLHAADRRLAEIVQGMTEACFALDAEWRFTFVNNRSQTLLRKAREDMLGREIWQVFHQLVGTAMEAHYRRAMRDRVPVAFEVFSPVAGRWLDIRLFPTAEGIAAFLLDIDARKKAEAAIRTSDERMQAVTENLAEGLVISDLDGQLLHWNRACLEMCGYTSREEAMHKLPEFGDIFEHAIFEGEVLPMEEWPLSRVLRGETVRDLEIRLRRLDRDWTRILSYSGAIVQDASGKRLAFLAINDISARKQTEAALRESEDRFRTMTNSMPQLAWIANATGFIFWYNERWYNYTGTTAEAMQGWGWQSVHDPQMLPKVLENWGAAIASGQRFEMQFPLRGADGRFRDFLTRVEPLRNDRGEVVQWFGTNTDVDALKQMEGSLRATQARLNSTLSAGAIGTWTWEIGTDCLVADEFTARVFSLKAEDAARGLPAAAYLAAVVAEDQPAVSAGLARAIEECGSYDLEYRVAQRDGSHLWLQARGRVEANAAGHAAHFHGAVMDITARKIAEAAVRELNAQLEQRVIERTAQLEAANKELEAFSYSVSHDLRAPLRAVDGFSQAVLEDYGPQLPPDGQRYLGTIRESAQRMGNLIDDLLAFARLSRAPLKKNRIETAKLVESVWADLRGERGDAAVELQLRELAECSGDSALLRQVWVNLLSNAVKYSRRRPAPIVEVGCRRGAGETVFFVRDSGTGFDMRYAEKLFGVFQRLHRAEDFEGTGVGLAIVQRIVHRHGGRIWAEAEVDRGATFFFTLAEEPENKS